MRIHYECAVQPSSEVRQTIPIRIRCECAMRPYGEVHKDERHAHSLRMRNGIFYRTIIPNKKMQ